MIIKYKNLEGTFITEQQLDELEAYSKLYYDNNELLIREEVFYENELMGLVY